MRSPRPAQPKVLLPTLLSCLWPWFLGCSVLALIILPAQVTEFTVVKWTNHPALGAVLHWLMYYFDAIWLLLAAVNAYRYMVQREGLKTARQWGLLLIVTIATLLWAGLRSSTLLGLHYYTSRLGWRAEGLPPAMAWVIWFTLVLCSYYAAQALLNMAKVNPNRIVRALAGAAIFSGSAFLLNQVAWKVRFYWLWPMEESPLPYFPPMQGIGVWFLVTGALYLAMQAIQGQPTPTNERFPRPVVILLIINAVFLIAHLVNL